MGMAGCAHWLKSLSLDGQSLGTIRLGDQFIDGKAG